MKKNEYSAEVIAHSVGPNGKQIYTVLLQFHQSVNAELWKRLANSRQLSFKMRNGTHCLCTATEWDEFFHLCHPWRIIPKDSDEAKGFGGIAPPMDLHAWGTEVDLNFPAGHDIQTLAIEMKKAMDASTPTQLEAPEYHLPFITDDDRPEIQNIYDGVCDDTVSLLMMMS